MLHLHWSLFKSTSLALFPAAAGFLHLLLPQPRTFFIPLLVIFRSQVQRCQPFPEPSDQVKSICRVSLCSEAVCRCCSFTFVRVAAQCPSASLTTPSAPRGQGFIPGPDMSPGTRCKPGKYDPNEQMEVTTSTSVTLRVCTFHKLQTRVNEPSDDTEIITEAGKERNHYLLSASLIAKEKNVLDQGVHILTLTATLL